MERLAILHYPTGPRDVHPGLYTRLPQRPLRDGVIGNTPRSGRGILGSSPSPAARRVVCSSATAPEGAVAAVRGRFLRMSDDLTPRPEHRFTFGLWTVGNPGRDPFGDPTRAPLDPVDAVERLAELGAWGVSLHDNDLVPWGAPGRARPDRRALQGGAASDTGLGVGMATTNLFTHPAFKDGAFTSNDRARAARRDRQGDALDRPRRRARRRDVCLLGRPRGHRGGRRQGPARRAGPLSRGDRRPRRLRARAGLRPALRARAQAQRAARRHLPADRSATRCTSSRRCSDPRWSASTRRSRTRRWRACRSTTASRRRCGPASSSTSTSTASGSGATTRTSASAPRTSRRRSCSCACSSARATTGPRHFDAHAYRNEDADGVWDFAAAACAPTSRSPSARAASTRCPRSRRRCRPRAWTSWASRPSGGDRADVLKAEVDQLDALGARGYFNERLDQLLVDVLLGTR